MSSRRSLTLIGTLAIPLAVLWVMLTGAAEPAVFVPPPAVDQPAPAAAAAASQTVVLAGGCFWGVQAVFQHVGGVTRAVSGYAGGAKDTADYETVSGGASGHAESVAVTFDPKVVSLGKILQVYFSVAHDPTQRDRQGPDVGSQYRSAIFVADESQRRVAEGYIAQLGQAGVFSHPIATQVNTLTAFYPAEAYHQDFATRHPDHGYIVTYDLPKIENLKRMFPDLYRAAPVLVSSR